MVAFQVSILKSCYVRVLCSPFLVTENSSTWKVLRNPNLVFEQPYILQIEGGNFHLSCYQWSVVSYPLSVIRCQSSDHVCHQKSLWSVGLYRMGLGGQPYGRIPEHIASAHTTTVDQLCMYTLYCRLFARRLTKTTQRSNQILAACNLAVGIGLASLCSCFYS